MCVKCAHTDVIGSDYMEILGSDIEDLTLEDSFVQVAIENSL